MADMFLLQEPAQPRLREKDFQGAPRDDLPRDGQGRAIPQSRNRVIAAAVEAD
jgi:hypothetical protein